MRIQGKLTTLSLVFGVFPLLIGTLAAFLSASNALHGSGYDRLQSIRDAKKQQIEQYFTQIHDQVLTFSNSTMIQDAAAGFVQGFDSYLAQVGGTDATVDSRLAAYYRDSFGARYQAENGTPPPLDSLMPTDPTVLALQQAYIADNPHPLGEKENLDHAPDLSDYGRTHARYHPAIRQYLRRFGYYDIFIADARTGHIVYSVFKELDYATSLRTGPYRDTNFARAFRRAADTDRAGAVVLEDFEPYTPSYEAPASFIASPIYRDGEKIAVLLFQMPVDRISQVLEQRTGMGESGEVYLVGSDRLMRSNSRFDEASTILKRKVDTAGVNAALGGATATAVFDDYRGVPVMSAYAPVSIDGVDWVILAELDEAEALASVTHLGLLMLGLTAVTAAVVAGMALVFARRMARPITQAADIARNITQGSLDNPIDAQGNDELADLLRALDEMQRDLKRRIQSEEEAAQNERIKAALDSVDTAVLATGPDNHVIYANDAATRLLAVAAPGLGDLVGQDLGDTVGGLRDGLADTANSRFEYRWEINARTVDFTCGQVRDASGRSQGWVAQLFDRTEELAAATAERERIERERAVAAANTRIKVALDNVNSAVIVADTERNIIYANHSAIELFENAADSIRQELPHFDASNLLDVSIDQFHRQPAHQANMLAELRDPYQADMEIGGRSIRIVANPVVDSDGNRLGTAVEWQDRTNEVAVEREIDALVEAASRGDLGQRIDLSGKSGFFQQLGSGFNALLDELSGVFDDIARVMGQLADGDLRSSIERDYEGTFDKVKKDINRTTANLNDVVGKLASVADQVGSAVGEIASGNSNLSNRTEQQAANLEETASSLEQLTATVRANADNAQQANQLAANARGTAERGGEVVTEAVRAMEQISASSKKIGEIVSVIDEIAFQTNLLALNASVEAARAGEQGRGFAVVATEVRNLASRSAGAAKEIKDLIGDSGKKVDVGAGLVNQSGEALQEIVDSVKKVGDIVAEIAAASTEQSAGIDQVNRSVTEMDNMTQQNAALAEQTSAASAAVGENAEELKELVTFFRTQ
jgi:methyl-accepting chemotaxis protein